MQEATSKRRRRGMPLVAHVAVPRGVNDPRLISFSSAMLTLRLRQVEGAEQVLHPPLTHPP